MLFWPREGSSLQQRRVLLHKDESSLELTVAASALSTLACTCTTGPEGWESFSVCGTLYTEFFDRPIYRTIHRSDYLFVSLSIYLPIYLSVSLSACLAIDLFIKLYLSSCLSICLSIYRSIHPSIRLSSYRFICRSNWSAVSIFPLQPRPLKRSIKGLTARFCESEVTGPLLRLRPIKTQGMVSGTTCTWDLKPHKVEASTKNYRPDHSFKPLKIMEDMSPPGRPQPRSRKPHTPTP